MGGASSHAVCKVCRNARTALVGPPAAARPQQVAVVQLVPLGVLLYGVADRVVGL